MRRIGLLLGVLVPVLLAGCDGDSTTATTARTPVTIDSGAVAVGPGSSETLSKFNISEPGRVEVTVMWSTGPDALTLLVEAAGGAVVASIGGSPLVTRMDVTQALLDSSSLVGAVVANNEPVNVNQKKVDAEIQFTITFTPEG
jgi:hypothetical protein